MDKKLFNEIVEGLKEVILYSQGKIKLKETRIEKNKKDKK